MMKSMQWSGVIASLVSLIALSGCGGDDPAEGDEPAPGTHLSPPASYTILSATDAPAGTTTPPAVYGSVCLACHRENGQGFASIAPEIRHTPLDYAMFVVRNGIKNDDGTPSPMIPYPAMSTDPMVTAVSDADLTAIIQWSNSLPKPTTPSGLYMDFCGNCHGPTNMGAGGSVPVKIQGLSKQTISDAVRKGFNPADKTKRHEYMPAFDATLLNDAELAQIQTYLGAM